jgi:hypothetical protein
MNDLNHDRTLAALFTEAKYAKNSRRWSRYGRNGENTGGVYARDARRAYNRATRKASKEQLNRYQAPATELPGFVQEDCAWLDALLFAEENRFDELNRLYSDNN